MNSQANLEVTVLLTLTSFVFNFFLTELTDRTYGKLMKTLAVMFRPHKASINWSDDAISATRARHYICSVTSLGSTSFYHAVK